MRFLGSASLAALLGASSAFGQATRPVARTFFEAAPDQEAFHELTTPEGEEDEDDRIEEDEVRVARIRDLTRVAEGGKTEISRAQAYFEKAQLLQERAAYLREQAIQAYDLEFDRWWIGEASVEPTLNLDPWRQELLKRINTLRDMAAKFPRDPRAAEVHWLIASSMARLGNEHCEPYFKLAAQLAKAPELAAKIRVSRADWAMSRGEVDKAAMAYDDIRTGGSEQLKAYATYRLGWTYVVKAEKAEGAARLDLLRKAEAALKLAFLTQKEDEDTRFKLRAESGDDLAWLWAVTGAEKDALAFFEKQGDKRLLARYRERQVDEWLRNGEIAKARAFFAAKLAEDPEDPLAPDYHLRLAHAHVVAGDVAGVKLETQAIAKLTTDKEDPWFDEHEDEPVMARAKKIVALLPLAAGFKLYEAAESATDPKRKQVLLTSSVRDLTEKIQTVTDFDKVLTIRVMLVKALIALARYPEALDQLDLVVKLGARAGPQLAPAALERLNILVTLDGQASYPPIPDPGEVRTPLPLPDLKKRFAAAAAAYLEIVPDADIAPNLKYQIAYDLFVYGHYDAALPKLEAFVSEYPRGEQTRSAIEICLSMNLKRKNWDELIRLSTAFLNNRDVKGKDLRQYIKENLDWAREQVKEAGPTVH